jgi:RsiW-degrading membrane proteinase PrsW (M82 family)
VPLGIGLAAIGVAVFLTTIASLDDPRMGLIMLGLVIPSGLVLWVATWITWVNTDSGAMRYEPWQTVVTGALVGIGVGVLTIVVQGAMILCIVFSIAAIRKLGV